MKLKMQVILPAIIAIVLGVDAIANAQARSWVSGVGDDANPCGRTAPCKTFAGAISKTSAGGEIDVLDSGGFGAVTITKAISIEAGGVIGGVSVSGTNGIIINAGVNDVVVLRGLTIEGLGTGLNGIRFLAGKALHVENCTINHFSQSGIDFEAAADAALFVTNVVSRNNMNGILIATSGNGSAEASLDTVQLLANQNGLNAAGLYNVSMRNSEIARNSNNGVQAQSSSSSLNLESIVVANNEGNGVQSTNSAQIRITNLLITNNGKGLFASSGGSIISFGNNRIGGNGTNGAPTMTVAQQ